MIVPVYVRERLYIPRAPEFDEMLEELRTKFTYTNPDYIKLKALNRWTGSVHKQVKTWSNVTTEEWDECISIPRGGTQKVRKVFDNYGLKPQFVDLRLSLPPITNLYNDVTLRPDQQQLAEAMFNQENCLIRSPTASGKCLAPDTKILTYNGHVVEARDICKGDRLMGPDGRPRLVESTTTGYSQLYEIIPKRCPQHSWICNEYHVLTLVNTSSGNIIDIPLNEYLEQSNWFKHMHKLYSVGVEFPFHPPLILDEPYFIGLWLGDGRKDLRFIEITNQDQEVIDYIYKFAHRHLLEPKTYQHDITRCPQHRLTCHGTQHPLLNKMREIFKDGIRIPHEYKIANRWKRLQLLAGLIDSDGCRISNSYYEITQKNKELAEDIWFVGRSLGFYTSINPKQVNNETYWRVNICGEVEEIPVHITRKVIHRKTNHNNSTHLGFDVQPVRQGKYVGWTLSGDGRFLLGDFTVTHNTETALKVAEWILKTAGPVIIIVWESGLLDQWVERIAKRFGLTEKDIGILGGGKKRVAPLTVAMQQTLMRKGYKYSHAFGGMICDEIQRFAAPTYQKVVDIFPARFRIGISADETRNDRKEFLIYDAFGEIADEIKKVQLIEEGKIHEIIIRIVPTEFDYEIKQDGEWVPWSKLKAEDKDPDDFMNVLITNEDRNDLIWHFMEPSFKAGHTCLIVARRRAHAIYWDHRIRQAGYTSGLMMGQGKEKGSFYKNEFKRTINGLRTGKVQIGVGTIQKTGTGHDIPQIDRGFILAPLAGNKQLFEQVLGRFRRICRGKTEAAVYYFWDQLCYPNDKRIISKRYKQTFVWVDKEFLPT